MPETTVAVVSVAPAAPQSIPGAILAFVLSGTGRRLLAFLLGFLTVTLNKKFGFDLDASTLVGDLTLILGYIGQSSLREASDAHADAKVQAAGLAAAAKPGSGVDA